MLFVIEASDIYWMFIPLLRSITDPPLPAVKLFLFSRSSTATATASDAPTAVDDDDDVVDLISCR